VHRGCRTGQVVYFVNFQKYRVDYVMTNQFKMRIAQKMADIVSAAGIKIIETNDFIIFFQQPFTEMGTQESRSAGNKYALCHIDLLTLIRFIMVISFELCY